MSSDRPRPPSVERLLAAVAAAVCRTDADADALAAVAREIADERARLDAPGEPAADVEAWPTRSSARLDGLRRPVGGAA